MTVTHFPRAPAPIVQATTATFTADMSSCAVVAACPLAARVLGWKAAGAGGYRLDAAMPAASVLRRFARQDRDGTGRQETLVLWGALGTVIAKCTLKHAGEGLVRVTMLNIADLIAACPQTGETYPGFDVTGLTSAAKRQPPPMPESDTPASPAVETRDDRATLQLIARSIEDGMKASSARQPAGAFEAHDPEDGGPGESAAPTHPALSHPAPIPPARAERETNDNAARPADEKPVDAARAVEPAAATSHTQNSQGAFNQPDANDAALSDRRALAEVFAKTAHDIKTPLSAISAASEIIRDERLGPSGNERYRTYAADIHASARHALAIVDRLMKMPLALDDAAAGIETVAASAPQAHTQPEPADALQPQPRAPRQPHVQDVDLNALISASAAELRPLMEDHSLRLSLRLEPGAPRIAADAVALKQALLNLLTNAMKFTAAAGTIHIETDARAQNGGVKITVRDTGRGMTKGAIARHLDAEAGAPAKNKTETGLGLGLPQVRAFCHEAGATLAIDSTLGRGTAVSLTFPAGLESAAPQPAMSPKS